MKAMQRDRHCRRTALSCDTPAANCVLCFKDCEASHLNDRSVISLPPTPSSGPVLVTFDDKRDDEAGVGVDRHLARRCLSRNATAPPCPGFSPAFGANSAASLANAARRSLTERYFFTAESGTSLKSTSSFGPNSAAKRVTAALTRRRFVLGLLLPLARRGRVIVFTLNA